MTNPDQPQFIPDASGKPRYYEPAPQDIDVANFRKVIESRRSVRKFTERAIPSEVLDACLDLALLAPNSSNLQPWTFYLVQSPAKKKQLVKACLNQLAAKTAAELIICIARTDRLDAMPNRIKIDFHFHENPPPLKKILELIP